MNKGFILEKTVKALAEHVGGKVLGDGEIVIRGVGTLSEAGEGDISFLANKKYKKDLPSSQAVAVVLGDEVEVPGKAVIYCKDPYYAFRQIVVLLHGFRQHEAIGISPKASVASSAKVGKNVDIYDFASVSADAEIGDGAKLYPGCFVGAGSKIGKDSVLHPNVTIYDGCEIGDRVTIHSGTVIGQDGFGYATHQGAHHKIPQIGGVVIEDDVEIGANCTVDRGTLGNTVIGKGTKFSNQIAIGHNTRIGPHCLLVAQVGIAGSTTVGQYCVFAGQAGIVGHIKIGDQVTVGAQAGVTNDIADGESVVGSPAMPLTQAKRSMLMVKRLPDLRDKLRELDRSLRKIIKG